MPTGLDTTHSSALARALADGAQGLRAEDRVLMRLFYVERLTLREIGRALGVHKSTISRRLGALQDELLHGAREAVRRRAL